MQKLKTTRYSILDSVINELKGLFSDEKEGKEKEEYNKNPFGGFLP